MFKKILIANRGEIACRVIAASARRLGIKTVAVYSDADAGAKHVAMADEAVPIGPAPAAESYLRTDRIIAAARGNRRRSDPPRLRFSVGEPGLRRRGRPAAGLVFIGPPASAIRAMGLKDAAKALMVEAGVPVVPGYHGDQAGSRTSWRPGGRCRIGYPVLIKARAGGGGKGMRLGRGSSGVQAPRSKAPAAGGRGQLRRPGLPDREIRHPAAPHRDPGLRRRPRQRPSICSSAIVRCSAATKR